MSLRVAAQKSTPPGRTPEQRLAVTRPYGFDGVGFEAQGEGRFEQSDQHVRDQHRKGIGGTIDAALRDHLPDALVSVAHPDHGLSEDASGTRRLPRLRSRSILNLSVQPDPRRRVAVGSTQWR
jgi:hypothetical protein